MPIYFPHVLQRVNILMLFSAIGVQVTYEGDRFCLTATSVSKRNACNVTGTD
jgi:hypothetical protein